MKPRDSEHHLQLSADSEFADDGCAGTPRWAGTPATDEWLLWHRSLTPDAVSTKTHVSCKLDSSKHQLNSLVQGCRFRGLPAQNWASLKPSSVGKFSVPRVVLSAGLDFVATFMLSWFLVRGMHLLHWFSALVWYASRFSFWDLQEHRY